MDEPYFEPEYGLRQKLAQIHDQLDPVDEWRDPIREAIDCLPEWISVANESPRIDGVTVYIGMNDAGFCGCFTSLMGVKCPGTGNVTWHCDYETAEETVRVMSGLAYWMPMPPMPSNALAQADAACGVSPGAEGSAAQLRRTE